MIKRFILAVVFIAACLFTIAGPETVAAADLINPSAGDEHTVCEGRGKSSAACTGRTADDPLSGSTGIILKAAQIVGFVAGAAAIIVVIYSGLKYITSSGDAQKAANAKGTLFNALIGLFVIFLAEALLMWFIRKIYG